MSTIAPRLWRTEPRYEGLCSDGWFQTPDGRLHFRERPPLITMFIINGRRPEPGQVAAIERAVMTAPPRVIAGFGQAGGQIQVVAGEDCRHHPLYPRDKRIPAGQVVAGFCSRQPLVVAIAAEADPAVVLHELGHFTDGPNTSRFSESITWATHREQVAELYGFSPYHRSTRGEAFAETFREWCKGGQLPEPARRLMRAAVART